MAAQFREDAGSTPARDIRTVQRRLFGGLHRAVRTLAFKSTLMSPVTRSGSRPTASTSRCTLDHWVPPARGIIDGPPSEEEQEQPKADEPVTVQVGVVGPDAQYKDLQPS